MKDTPTPRTDAKQKLKDIIGDEYVAVDFARQLEDELTTVTEQLNKAHETIGTMIDEIGMLQLKDKATTEQRDRLAEALERILAYQGRFAEEDPESIAKEALQSLTKTEP